MTRYEQQTDGEWVQPIHRGYRVMCCDCGLVHVMNFRLRKGRIQLQAMRNQRATSGVRRRRGIKVTKEN